MQLCYYNKYETLLTPAPRALREMGDRFFVVLSKIKEPKICPQRYFHAYGGIIPGRGMLQNRKPIRVIKLFSKINARSA